MRLYDALVVGDFATLAQAMADRLDVAIAPETLRVACGGDILQPGSQASILPRADDTVIAWLKNRLHSIKGFPEPGQQSIVTIDLPVPMHVGFPCLCETDEQLARLRNDPEAIQESSVARSKMFETLLATVHPINRVADRVAHDPET